ncbi:MAG TPA: ATPase domain-containing protein [Terriglobales bacterium]|nr:ATPase domain-containing protein [Terriglobales bacterium]
MPDNQRLKTGVAGFDDIMNGGFPANYFYLLEGDPGAGKTTLALQFLLEGIRNGENVLYVTLSETRKELEAVARSHGWNLEKIPIFELFSERGQLSLDDHYTVFHPSDVELADTARTVITEVEKINPTRLVIDSLAELRMLAREPIVYRRQIMAFKHHFEGSHCTVLLLDDRTGRSADMQLQSIVHGVITMEKLSREYGITRRRLESTKMRGMQVREGFHDYIIRKGGVCVFPRMEASKHQKQFEIEPIASGVSELDRLLGGGIDRGTSTLLVGPAGCGKSTVALQFASAAANRAERVCFYTFEESQHTFMERARGLHIDLQTPLEKGILEVEQLDPAILSPGEFVENIRAAVEERNTRMVVIDSLNGFLKAMPGEDFLAIQLHELLTFLNQQGVVTIMVLAQAGVIGSNMQSPVDVSYLADAILLLRYFEAYGEVRQAISVVKKRSGRHERTIRELQLGPNGVRVGEPLRNFQGVLSGTPTFLGGSAAVDSTAAD